MRRGPNIQDLKAHRRYANPVAPGVDVQTRPPTSLSLEFSVYKRRPLHAMYCKTHWQPEAGRYGGIAHRSNPPMFVAAPNSRCALEVEGRYRHCKPRSCTCVPPTERVIRFHVVCLTIKFEECQERQQRRLGQWHVTTCLLNCNTFAR